MKRIKLMLALFCLPLLIHAQSGKSLFDKDISWDKKTETKTHEIKVSEGAKKLKFLFESNISNGALKIAAYDPNGNRVSGFSLICGDKSFIESSSDSEGDNVLVVNTNSKNKKSGKSNYTISTNSSSNSKTTTVINSSSDGNTNINSDEGNTVIYTSSSSKKNSAKGIMNKDIDDPTPGLWKFVFELKDVTGSLKSNVIEK